VKRKRIEPKPGLDAYEAARDIVGKMVKGGCRLAGMMVIDEQGFLHCEPDTHAEACSLADQLANRAARGVSFRVVNTATGDVVFTVENAL
jgi:hypothetical protein